MTTRATEGAGAQGAGRRQELTQVLARLEAELLQTEAALLALGAERVAGLHLVVDVAGQRAVLAGSRVRTVVPLLATQPVPGAPAEVLGTFVLRGAPVTVVDVARWLGVEREPSLKAAIVVIGGARAVGILVDGVLAVEERIDLVQGAPTRDDEGPLSGARLVSGLCRWKDQVLPLLDLKPLLASVEEAR